MNTSSQNIRTNAAKNTIVIAFAAMTITYCLGVFNDNFFKQTAMLLAVEGGQSKLQGYATILFSLPFIFFSAYGGWCADVFSKKKVIIAVKALEVFAMGIGAIGLLLENWGLILAMVFLMGLQSTFFSPALNGSIPEMYSGEKIPRVNAILKLATTLAILVGIAFAGISLDQKWLAADSLPQVAGHKVSFGVWLVAVIALLMAAIGFFASFALFRRPAAGGTQSFPWSGPMRSVTDLFDIIRDRQLMLGILCDAWFYFISVLAIQFINTLGINQFNFSQSRTSLLSVSLMIGVCVGSFIAAKVTTPQCWSRYLKLSCLGMGVCLFLTGFAPLVPASVRFLYLVVTLAVAGCAGGIFLIPTATILQVRPKETEKGRVLSVASFCSFIAILFAGVIFSLIDGLFSPTLSMIFIGIAGILFALVLGGVISIINCDANNPISPTVRRVLAMLLKGLLNLRYKVEEHGLAEIRKKRATEGVAKAKKTGILFLPNHPALIDPLLVSSRLLIDFTPRPLSDEKQLANPLISLCAGVVRPITIPDSQEKGASAKKEILRGMQAVVKALKAGDNVLFYPAGRLNRTAQENLGANSGVEYLLKKVPEVQVILVRSNGLWGSSFSYAVGKVSLFAGIKKYLLAALCGAIFFIPKRKVRIDFVEDSTLKKLQQKHEINDYLERFYNALPVQCQRWPLFLWKGREPEVFREFEAEVANLDETFIQRSLANIENNLRSEVLKK